MPGKRRGKFLLGAIIGLLICWRIFAPRIDGPRGHIFWSLAVVRWPGDWKNVEATRIYLATTDAVYVPSGLMSWRRKQVGTGDAPLVALAADAHGNVAAGSTDGQVFVSHDGGERWETYKVSAYPVSSILIHGGGDALIVATFGGGVFDIKDGTSQRISSNGPDVNVWCLFERNDHSLMALTARGAYDSPDGGHNWRQTNGPSSAAMCSKDGKGNLFAVNDGDLLVSNDDGRATTRLIFGDGSALQAWSIATDEAGDAVVGTSAGPYWSEDGGRTWERLELSKNPHIATSFLLAAPAWAQEIRAPAELPRLGPVGPTLLPPMNMSLNPQTATNINGVNSANIPTLPPSAIPSGNGPYVPSTSHGSAKPGGVGGAPDEKPPGPGGGDGGGPPPPRIVYDQFPGFPVPCSEDSQGGITCPAADVEEYLTDVGRSAAITNAVAQLVRGHSVLVVGAGVGKEFAIEKAMQVIVKRMMDHAVLPIQAFAQATNSPVMVEAVRAHEAYVQRIGDEAIKESVQRVNTSLSSNSGDSNRSGSQLNLNTSGPAFHHLSYSSVHGAGWW